MIQQHFQVFTKEEQDFINNNLLSAKTEWRNAAIQPNYIWRHYKSTLIDKDDAPMMAHRVVQRNDDLEGVPVSPFWDFLEPIFHRVRKNMGLPFDHVLRSSINLTWNHPAMHSVPHKDHYKVDHYNMVMHLTPISQGGTFIFGEDEMILEESSPTVWSATSFGGLWHAQGFCAPGETRVVAVITWR